MENCDWERLVAAGLPVKDAQEAQQEYALVTIRSSLDGGLVQVLRRIAHHRKRQENDLHETTPERKRSRSVSIGPMRMELLSFESMMMKKRRMNGEDTNPVDTVSNIPVSSITKRHASAILSRVWDFIAAASVFAHSACEEACGFAWTFLQLPNKNQDDIELLFDEEDKLWAADCEIEQARMRTRAMQKQMMTPWRTQRIT